MIKNGTLKEVIEGWFYGTEDYVQTSNEPLFRENGVLYSYGYHFPLAMHVGGYQLINADTYGPTTSKHQSYTIRTCSNPVEIPFSALVQALLGERSYNDSYRLVQEIKEDMCIIDTKQDQWVQTGTRIDKNGVEQPVMTHIMGATLFSYQCNYFISGLDETAKWENRYFMTKLLVDPYHEPPTTVEEAYECMKPSIVKIAEEKGVEVKRQGEWFFIPTGDNFDQVADKKHIVKNGLLEEGGHHTASEVLTQYQPTLYARGIVKHTNKEHKQLKLYDNVKDKKWYMVVHNVQMESYAAAGNVD